MSVFFALLLKLIPLYTIIALGFFARRSLDIRKESFSSLIIYIFAPIMVFQAVATAEMDPQLFWLTVISFGISTVVIALFYLLASFVWKDEHRNILAYATSQGNLGYFGIPVAMMLFGQDILSVYIFIWLGPYLHSFSLGYLVVASGKHSLKESFLKFSKVPVVYAFALGLLLNRLGVLLPDSLLTVTSNFVGAYSVLGMMMIGLGLAELKRASFDWAFLSLSFLGKFVAWPLLTFLVIWIDQQYFQFFTRQIHQLLILMAVVPLAADTVSFATEFKTEPEKVSLAVVLSTLVALLLVPAVTSFF